MAKKDAPQDSAGAEAKPAGKLKLIILIAVALLLAVGLSVGGTWFLLSKDAAGTEVDAQAPAEAGVPDKLPAIYEELAPAFVVNFDYKGRPRYMQVSVALMARDSAALEALKVHMPVLRNRLVMLFSSQDFEALTTPVGMEMLRQQATSSVQELAQKETGKLAVEQVLFTNLVLQ
ncbi:flagellar basal body-associated protein FliL [Pseudomonas lalucatii]|uniref:Flagellar protein FliL n=1 Tax=Pseudomonas lalucatii TaxID=1424203 RepID=A0ABS5Q2R3_9PSED|nr:flagellar basal body-associated protein FliL [Pseudomonas lalucatii]MBS7663057.1 flagellar basal body-associated protein FliL [Pseudomonas lalucatii]MBS7690042.1 flagellar basal body-associated protein FliL [Pseudomonas lalucatii]MBS7724803.1 flagellar basal body-associated protein FliL [Pseudomonas lalucatii]QVM87220.1 flagellar basal body-associated protein FliL [Pseudomonas lalucatii]